MPNSRADEETKDATKYLKVHLPTGRQQRAGLSFQELLPTYALLQRKRPRQLTSTMYLPAVGWSHRLNAATRQPQASMVTITHSLAGSALPRYLYARHMQHNTPSS